MKTRLATALSVAGVLTAGSAAALVNTQVLDSSKQHSSSPAIIVPVAVSRIDTPASGGSTSPSPAASNGTNSGEDSYEGGTEGGQDD